MKTTELQPRGLRPELKPFVVEMSGAFMKAATKLNLVALVKLIKRIFLRLGYDSYRCENTDSGFRIRICGHSLITGRYSDTHKISIGKLDMLNDFIAGVVDCGSCYVLRLKLVDEHDTKEAA